jgi:N6-adenosine-specific RNA methylase IME4
MTVEQIRTFPIPKMLPDSILFLWQVASMQQAALDVAEGWGYAVKSEIVWVKRTKTGKPWFGMGRYVRAAHETCLVATRGKAASYVLDHGVRSVFEAKVSGHSVKPDAFYALVEQLVRGPRAEIFARKRRAGWTQFGDQLEPEGK